MTLEQILWWLFVVYHGAALLMFAALEAWALWGVIVLVDAAYLIVRLRWMEQ
jgi:hypothetical protein